MIRNSTIKVSKKQLPCGHFDYAFSKGRCRSCAQKEDTKPLKITPLPKSTVPLAKSKKKIAPVSAKRKVLNLEYKKVRDAYMRLHPICEVVGCRNKSSDNHHRRGKIGDDLANVEFFMAVCRKHHHEIEMKPLWAKENGYSINRLT